MFSHIGKFALLFLFSASALSASSILCESLFILPQNETISPIQTPFARKEVARLFMAPIKASTSSSKLSIPKEFLDTKLVLFEAQKELERRVGLTSATAALLHVDFLALQLPHVAAMLDSISTTDLTKSYYLVSRTGERISNLSNVKSVIDFLKQESDNALKNRTVTAEFFTTYVMEVLGLHFALWQKLDFDQIDEFERYHGHFKAFKSRPKSHFSNDFASDLVTMPITPLIQFLNKMTEIKTKIFTQTLSGLLLWPTFSSAVSEDFQNWHLGIKLIGVSLDRQLTFDGNVSDFFGLATHDIANHTIPTAILEHRQQFSNFKKLFFKKITEQPSIQREIIGKIWFLATHESGQSIYREYLLLVNKRTSAEHSVKDLEADLRGAVILPETGGNEFPILVNQLKSQLHYLSETSAELQKLSPSELQIEVLNAWKAFLKIYHETSIAHFDFGKT